MPSALPTFTCGIDPEFRALVIRIALNNVTAMDDLMTPGTPQNMALNWLVDDDTAYLCPEDEFLVQRYSLAAHYYSLSGSRWFNCSAPEDLSDPAAIAAANAACEIEPVAGTGSDAWLTPSHECDWGGIACNDGMKVERLELGECGDGMSPIESFLTLVPEINGLSGQLVTELQTMQEMKVLSLEESVISGAIPAELGTMKKLEVLDLNFNLLNGTIPDELYDLENLRELDLNGNNLSGSISTLIGKLSQLIFFQVHTNSLTGEIPVEMGLLEDLGTFASR